MKNHSLLFFTIFIFSLVAGYTFSARFYPSNFNYLHTSLRVVTAQDQKPLEVLGTGQRSILLINVASLSSPHPGLESIWLATYLPASSDVRLLSIYPTGAQPISDFEVQLVSSFGLSKKNGQLILDQGFMDELVAKNYWWSGYIVFDNVAMAGIFDLLGGIKIKGQTLSGEQVITELLDAANQPVDAYSYQIAMLQSACKQLSQLSSIPDLSQVGLLLPRHVITDLRSDQLQAEFQSILAGERQPACKFPMLENSQIVQ